MSETNNPIPQLSLAPSAPEPEVEETPAESIQQTAAPVEEADYHLDESQLTEAEKKAVDDFITKVDITNPDHVLLFGADAQKKIADVRRMLDDVGSKAYLEVDGGMNIESIPETVALGADLLVVGSALYGAEDAAAVIDFVHAQ